MDYKRKAFHRREMLGCARIARYERKRNTPDFQLWEEVAAKHLLKLGGMCGNW